MHVVNVCINNLLKSTIPNRTDIGLLSVKTGLISWIATKCLLNIFCETKIGLLAYYL